jgi:hypothetical protein
MDWRAPAVGVQMLVLSGVLASGCGMRSVLTEDADDPALVDGTAGTRGENRNPCGRATDEGCDASDLDGHSCQSLGAGSGTLSCDPVTCTFDLSMCGGLGVGNDRGTAGSGPNGGGLAGTGGLFGGGNTAGTNGGTGTAGVNGGGLAGTGGMFCCGNTAGVNGGGLAGTGGLFGGGGTAGAMGGGFPGGGGGFFGAGNSGGFFGAGSGGNAFGGGANPPNTPGTPNTPAR